MPGGAPGFRVCHGYWTGWNIRALHSNSVTVIVNRTAPHGKVGHRMPQAELDARVIAEAVRAGFAEADLAAVAEYLRLEEVA